MVIDVWKHRRDFGVFFRWGCPRVIVDGTLIVTRIYYPVWYAGLSLRVEMIFHVLGERVLLFVPAILSVSTHSVGTFSGKCEALFA